MLKRLVCAWILGIFCCAVRAGNIDCVKFLRANDERICMKTLKETSPSIAALVDGTVYYASLTTENLGRIKVSYQGKVYSAYNYDNPGYELIHWLSGKDALVDGVWRDKIAIDGAMDFRNYGCTWNAAHDGYYSADGEKQYFQTDGWPKLNFGSDWYIEITAQVGNPIGNVCSVIDLSSLHWVSYEKCGTGLVVYPKDGTMSLSQNAKPLGNTPYGPTGVVADMLGNKAMFIFGSNYYGNNQSRPFILIDGNKYYGTPYDVVQWNRWDAPFYLFRGNSEAWNSNACDDGKCVDQCGPMTIYDIKVWRKK